MADSTEAIEKLYKCFSVLADAKDSIGDHPEQYLAIVAAVKGSSKEKILASQFITRFFNHFPDHAHDAIEALLDLCEDENVIVRKHAIKELPALCKENRHYTQKIADILAQLLQAEDTSELTVVNNSLLSLIQLDPKSCLLGIFSQIHNGDDIVREKCLRFLNNKLFALGSELINKDVEDILIAEAKKVLQDVSALEFNLLMTLLGKSRLSTSISGQQELVQLVAEQAEIGQTLETTSGEEGEILDRLINCVRHALPYFSSKIQSTKFVVYIVNQVLVQIDKLLPPEDETVELELLKVLAELTTYCGAVDNPQDLLTTLHARLIKYLPLPPPPSEDESETPEPRLEFSYVECLIYTFHQILKQKPDFLSDPDILKDFKLRLLYFARGIQGYITKLKEALKGKSEGDLKTDENKLKVVALKTTTNINTLIKDLFHSPPATKAVITLSWKPAAAGSVPKPSGHSESRKHIPITVPSQQGQGPKRARQLYQPPGGKFSNSLSSQGFRGRNRYRGRGRSRPY